MKNGMKLTTYMVALAFGASLALPALSLGADEKASAATQTIKGEVVEPMLTDQWFVAMTRPGADGTTIAGKAIEAVETGAVKFFPPQWINTYNQWMNNIQDWCISRQLWWGHQIPAWYDEDGKVYVARNEAVRKNHRSQ